MSTDKEYPYSSSEQEIDSYESFVAEMWAASGIDLLGIRLQRLAKNGVLKECILIKYINTNSASPGYVNVVEDEIRKTFVADDRHIWIRDGKSLNPNAFIAIKHGVDPETALRFKPAPSSIVEVLTPDNDRFPTSDRKFVIVYENDSGKISYHLISRVIRQKDTFTARCHFDWGERTAFQFEGLKSVADATTRENIQIEMFIQGYRR